MFIPVPNNKFHISTCMQWLEAILSEFQNSKCALSIRPTPPTSGSSAVWLAPPGLFKLNTALARLKNASPIVGELVALREGILLAQFYNICVDLAELSSTFAVSVLNDSLPSLWDTVMFGWKE
ncbi:hypothetical protein Ddye_005879 [Dipteronia dyeriana]|uniref:Uncharacterized protein n=1 Tax=Dipteronia dyeriana TaxID=168575 RepID=A0AAD9XHK0_9ROSI|nr:hypothetical protein Ddye_005879 [Dipteronia dyeriana]